MRAYTYSEARQNLAEVLDFAERDGSVEIRRRDGATFVLRPVKRSKSPLDVKGVKANISREEIVALIRQGRERE